MDKVKAVFILEILGKPAEYIKKTLSEIVESLGKEKDVVVLSKNIAEPKKLEEEGIKEDIFTSFAEIELETNLNKLMILAFAYMPSHIEVIEPENLEIKNSDLNIFLNELAKRLHQYDELAKALMIERQAIAKMIKEGKIKIEKEEKKKRGKRKKN